MVVTYKQITTLWNSLDRKKFYNAGPSMDATYKHIHPYIINYDCKNFYSIGCSA
jgi:hypothetical protein